MVKYGFSRMTGVVATVVKGEAGQDPVGGWSSPTKTMFHTPPCQLVSVALRVKNCCCEPDVIFASIAESAMNPPLDHPPSDKVIAPLTWTRRRSVPWETAQTFTFESCVGTIA